MNITNLFIDEILAVSEIEIPDRVIHQVKRCLLDYIGVTFAGAFTNEEKFLTYLKNESSGENCPVIGLNKKSDLNTASILNGFASHVLELDDGHRFAMLHLGAPIFSALLTIAKKDKLDFSQFLKGVVSGYEAIVRLAKAIQPSHIDKGFHATGTCGTVGVAFAVAIALGFNKEQIKSAVSLAATSSSGLLEVVEDSSQIKSFNVSSAVLNGITAAYFGRLCFQGPDDVLGGNRGFLKNFADDIYVEAFYQDQEDIYQIENIYVKPYASCRHTHSAIEAALKIGGKIKLDEINIEKVEVRTYKLAIKGHDHTMIEGVASAKMSIPYSVAVALLLSEAGLNAFSEKMVTRIDILNLCEKVMVMEDDHLTALSPHKRGALVRVHMKDGRSFEQLVEYPFGEPENSMSDFDLEEKFIELIKFCGYSEEHIVKMINWIWNIEENFSVFLDLL